jgi:hypothetical protein
MPEIWGASLSNLETLVAQCQRAFCKERNVEYYPAPPMQKSGIALATKGRLPLNGLRHPAEHDTTGWYIWCGEEFLDAPDFFQPVHTSHIYEEYPQLVSLLGLPPGFRFLIAEGYLDIWYDDALLQI